MGQSLFWHLERTCSFMEWLEAIPSAWEHPLLEGEGMLRSLRSAHNIQVPGSSESSSTHKVPPCRLYMWKTITGEGRISRLFGEAVYKLWGNLGWSFMLGCAVLWWCCLWAIQVPVSDPNKLTFTTLGEVISLMPFWGKKMFVPISSGKKSLTTG